MWLFWALPQNIPWGKHLGDPIKTTQGNEKDRCRTHFMEQTEKPNTKTKKSAPNHNQPPNKQKHCLPYPACRTRPTVHPVVGEWVEHFLFFFAWQKLCISFLLPMTSEDFLVVDITVSSLDVLLAPFNPLCVTSCHHWLWDHHNHCLCDMNILIFVQKSAAKAFFSTKRLSLHVSDLGQLEELRVSCINAAAR